MAKKTNSKVKETYYMFAGVKLKYPPMHSFDMTATKNLMEILYGERFPKIKWKETLGDITHEHRILGHMYAAAVSKYNIVYRPKAMGTEDEKDLQYKWWYEVMSARVVAHGSIHSEYDVPAPHKDEEPEDYLLRLRAFSSYIFDKYIIEG